MEEVSAKDRRACRAWLRRNHALIVPRDLSAALTRAGARRAFDGFSPSSRRAILSWIGQAKRPQTRARRIATTARMAALGLRANFAEDPERPRA